MVNICYLLVAIFAQQKDPFNNIYRAANTMISCSYPMKRLMTKEQKFFIPLVYSHFSNER